MWLFLDTSERGIARVALIGDRIRTKIVRGRGVIVPSLSRLLPREQLGRLSGVCVVAGPGPFSAVRSGVLTANCLARLLRLPLYQLLKDDARDLELVRTWLREKRLRALRYVPPLYDAEPNITCHP